MITHVKKRNGKLVPYDHAKIELAIAKAFQETKEGDSIADANYIGRKVLSALLRAERLTPGLTPTVEGIQDVVERELMLEGFTKTAKHYILYREARTKRREVEGLIPEHVRKLTADSKQYFRNPLAEFVYYRTYSRWIDAENRRETWIETVNRYVDYMYEVLGDKLASLEYDQIRSSILSMEVMPSMRLMWAAGKAVKQTNVCAFNCAFIAPNCTQDFAEILYILACGTGIGFSVESRNIQQLPVVQHQGKGKPLGFQVPDSKEGWADGLAYGMNAWLAGLDVNFDFSLLRPEGARLNTMGGRSSGPKPYIELLNFVRARILKRQGRRLTNLDAHDIICKIGDAIVVGGVRRSALISLSDLDDMDLRHSKEGHFYITNGQRALANNSAVYEQKPTSAEFLDEWRALVQSHSGERGIFNRGGLLEQIPSRRVDCWDAHGHIVGGRIVSQVGTNPCGEINLLSKQFCNLTEVVCREDDSVVMLRHKVRIATILGTFQSMLTNYPYLSRAWQDNCERERLLGVSLTGQWDCPTIRNENVLVELRNEAIETNVEFAERFDINPSTAITCVKPSGTVSQLTDSSPGMHPRHSQYYIRRVRISGHDPLFQMLKDQGMAYFPEVGQTYDTANTWVFEFPVQAPEGTYSRDLSALDQLEYWRMVKETFTEHNPSVTISIDEDEWVIVANWLWEHWDIIGGLAFLPRDDHVYQLAPYEEISEEKYHELIAKFVHIDYAKIVTYEKDDRTEGSKELACAGGACDI